MQSKSLNLVSPETIKISTMSRSFSCLTFCHPEGGSDMRYEYSLVICDKYSRKKTSDKRAMPVYNHFTVAVDTNNIRIVFKDVKDTILKKNLDSLLLQ